MAVALINTSLRSVHAHESLTEILTTMSARLPAGASVRIPLLDRKLDAAGIAADPELAEALWGAGGRRLGVSCGSEYGAKCWIDLHLVPNTLAKREQFGACCPKVTCR